MSVQHMLETRKATRAFLSTPVDRALIEKILNAARHAPSGVNTQPWQVAVVAGVTRQELTTALESAFLSGEKSSMDYQYYPREWHGVYKERRKACGLQLYKTLGINREDKQRQSEQWAANYRAFDAPVILFFFLDKTMETGSFLDYGMFIQSIMLMAQELGLATCPQAALAEYPSIVKEKLDYSEETILLAGMALGYEDKDAPVNSYRTPREQISTFTDYFD